MFYTPSINILLHRVISFRPYWRLDVPVDIVLIMHILQSLGHLGRDRRRFGLWDRSVFSHISMEVTVLEKVHYDVEAHCVIEPAKKLDEIFPILSFQ